MSKNRNEITLSDLQTYLIHRSVDTDLITLFVALTIFICDILCSDNLHLSHPPAVCSKKILSSIISKPVSFCKQDVDALPRKRTGTL